MEKRFGTVMAGEKKIVFWGVGTFTVGGYHLVNPHIYVMCRKGEEQGGKAMESLDPYFYEYCLDISSIPPDLNDTCYETSNEFTSRLGGSSLPVIKTFLEWLSRQDGFHVTLGPMEKVYTAGLFHRIFFDKQDILSIFHIFSWFVLTKQGVGVSAKWFLFALALAKSTVEFSDEETRLTKLALSSLAEESTSLYDFGEAGKKWDPVSFLLQLGMEDTLNDLLIAKVLCARYEVEMKMHVCTEMCETMVGRYHSYAHTIHLIHKRDPSTRFLIELDGGSPHRKASISYCLNWDCSVVDTVAILESCRLVSPVHLTPQEAQELKTFLQNASGPNADYARILLMSNYEKIDSTVADEDDTIGVSEGDDRSNPYSIPSLSSVAHFSCCSQSSVLRAWNRYAQEGVSFLTGKQA